LQFKVSQANSSRDLISKTPNIKKGWWSGSRCRPSIQTLVPQKKKKNSFAANILKHLEHTIYEVESEG
jgi:hypothetical protein